ncbi:hypothetical protein PR003_g13846 [Phytophthora rubi]|uniref:CCHC-type domain-containing protein n=1 Tax=Phytophthora rubi TaxID=129364 RepID=A0A6A4FG39_9STRA|nr:hypothetical protein PR003_g13846 [Phytophthora rubi]
MSPSSREGSRKREWPTFSGNREEFDGFSQLLVFALSGDGKLGYIAVSDYNTTKPYTFQGREYPPVVNLQGKDSGPDSATPRASVTPRSGDNDDDEEEDDGGDGNTNAGTKKKKRKGKKKTSPSGLVTDGEEAAQLRKRMEAEKADVCYISVSSLPVNYRKLVHGLVCPHAMWQAIEGHFGTRDPTDYASSYTGVFRYRLGDAENPEMFVQTLDSNIITFERVIDAKLSDIFKSMILQHALPASWEYIVRGWLGQAKTLSYVKLMELVSSELKRRRPEGSGQDKGKAEKAYAAVEAKPTGGTIERKCFACKKPGHLVADCPENPNRGEKVGTSEPPKKKQNTGKQYSKKDTKRHDHRDRDKHDDGRRHDEGRRHEESRSPPRGQVSHASGQWTSRHSGAHEVSLAGTGTEALNPRITTIHVGLATVLHPQFVTNVSTTIRLRDTMIVDTIHSIMSDRHRSMAMLDRGHSTATPDRHSSTETNKAHHSGLVINVDHHPDGATRHHVDQETSLRRAGVDAHHREAALVHVNALTISKAVTVLMSAVGVRTTIMVTDHPVDESHTAARISLMVEADSHPSPVMNRESWRTEFQEGEKDLIAAHIRDKGMACIRRGNGTYEYKFERNRASNSEEEEDSDEGGSSGALVITRDDIIANINKNPKMTRTEKRLTRAMLGGSPLSPEDPYASDSVYSEEGLRFLSAAEAQEKQQETLKSLESQLREDMCKREEDNAVAPSIPATTEGDAVADPTPSQASAAVAADASAQAKPAIGLVSVTSTLNTNELTGVVDTGATSHMCKDIELFVQFEPIESSMETAANPLRILGKGTVRFPVKDSSNAMRTVELKDVNYVPRVAHNLFSVIKGLVNDGFEISIDKRECTLRHEAIGYVLSAPGGGGVDLYLLRGIGGLDILE